MQEIYSCSINTKQDVTTTSKYSFFQFIDRSANGRTRPKVKQKSWSVKHRYTECSGKRCTATSQTPPQLVAAVFQNSGSQLNCANNPTLTMRLRCYSLERQQGRDGPPRRNGPDEAGG